MEMPCFEGSRALLLRSALVGRGKRRPLLHLRWPDPLPVGREELSFLLQAGVSGVQPERSFATAPELQDEGKANERQGFIAGEVIQ